MEYVIVTGISGSGKSCVIDALEDIGYFCIDNMPPQLIPVFMEICKGNQSITKAAFVIDIRGGELFLNINETINQLRADGKNLKVLFLKADHNVIKRRYKETRRKHPLFEIAGEDIDKAIDAEYEILKPVEEEADYIIDTSLTARNKLKESILNIFLDNISESMLITCVSFGFMYGIPPEADLVFDVRCLPNPFHQPELKFKTGTDKEVQDYIMKYDVSRQLKNKLEDLISFLIPQYVSEGKSQLTIAFGCTGGRHRSVTFAEGMYKYLQEKNFRVRRLHRDIESIK